MGQIRKRGGVYWIRWDREGRRFEESATTDKWETARDLLRQREGNVSKGVPISAKIGRLRFEDASKDLLTAYEINGKTPHDNLKSTIVEGALEPWFRGRRMASLTTADIRAVYQGVVTLAYYTGWRINSEILTLEWRQIDREACVIRLEPGTTRTARAASSRPARSRNSSRRLRASGERDHQPRTLCAEADVPRWPSAGKLLARPHIPMLAEFFEREQFEAVRNRLAPRRATRR